MLYKSKYDSSQIWNILDHFQSNLITQVPPEVEKVSLGHLGTFWPSWAQFENFPASVNGGRYYSTMIWTVLCDHLQLNQMDQILSIVKKSHF